MNIFSNKSEKEKILTDTTENKVSINQSYKLHLCVRQYPYTKTHQNPTSGCWVLVFILASSVKRRLLPVYACVSSISLIALRLEKKYLKICLSPQELMFASNLQTLALHRTQNVCKVLSLSAERRVSWGIRNENPETPLSTFLSHYGCKAST